MCTGFRWNTDLLIRTSDRRGSVKVRELIKVVEGDGWYLSRQREPGVAEALGSENVSQSGARTIPGDANKPPAISLVPCSVHVAL